MNFRPPPRRTVSPATVIRGAALDAAIRWSRYAASRGETTDHRYELPRASKTPSDDEMAWNVCRLLYAQSTYNSLAQSDLALRRDFMRYQGSIESLLEAWQASCPLLKTSAILQKERYELSYLLMNDCGWPEDKVIAHTMLLHAKSCSYCGRKG